MHTKINRKKRIKKGMTIISYHRNRNINDDGTVEGKNAGRIKKI